MGLAGPTATSVPGMHSALAAVATLVSMAFAFSTFERWLARRRRHELAWSVALALFACGAGSLWWGATAGWDPVSFRLFYLFGAVLNVPFLALGTVYLLGDRRRADRWAAVVTVIAAFAAGVVLSSPLTADIPADVLPQGSDVFGPLPRIFAAVASAGGALVVFAGAVRSVFRRRLVVPNLVIALGVAILSASGLFNSVMDEMDAFAVSLATGIVVLFAGFLLATPAPARADRRMHLVSEARAEASSRPA